MDTILVQTGPESTVSIIKEVTNIIVYRHQYHRSDELARRSIADWLMGGERSPRGQATEIFGGMELACCGAQHQSGSRALQCRCRIPPVTGRMVRERIGHYFNPLPSALHIVDQVHALAAAGLHLQAQSLAQTIARDQGTAVVEQTDRVADIEIG